MFGGKDRVAVQHEGFADMLLPGPIALPLTQELRHSRVRDHTQR